MFDIRALWTERQSARMSKIKNGGLDQYGDGPSEQQQFGTAGVERVNGAQLANLQYSALICYKKFSYRRDSARRPT